MSIGLLVGSDEQVASHFLAPRNQEFFKYDRAIGIVKDGELVGTILFHGWNGANLELGYYGKGTVTAGIVRWIARFILSEFNLSRLTVVTSKRNRRLIKSLQRLGFKVEGVSRCFYGEIDCNRNTGMRFVAFKEQIMAVARIGSPEDMQQCS